MFIHLRLHTTDLTISAFPMVQGGSCNEFLDVLTRLLTYDLEHVTGLPGGTLLELLHHILKTSNST